jgi:hypothetical protein
MNKIMNKLFSATIIINLLFTFSLIGYSKQSVTSNNYKESTEPESKELLLEIYTKYEGMMHPKGTLLEIRLYSTGDAEFDYFLPSQMGGDKPNETTRKDVRLEQETVQQIKTLIEAPDFISANGFYPPSIPLSDASTTTTITFKRQQQEKKIVLEETDTILHLNKKDKVYPKSVITLLRVIENLRTKFES